jgi:hypothetical protein
MAGQRIIAACRPYDGLANPDAVDDAGRRLCRSQPLIGPAVNVAFLTYPAFMGKSGW